MAVNIKKGMALSALNITPLIDVVFLLLIFFLVATRFAEEDREMDVMLPSASDAVPLTVKRDEIFVNINEHGQIFVGNQEVNEDELKNQLQRAVVNNPVDQAVIIRADKRVELQHAVTVMNLCNMVGITDYSLTIEGG